MRTTIVIFTDHKVPVSEIPNYKKYKLMKQTWHVQSDNIKQQTNKLYEMFLSSIPPCSKTVSATQEIIIIQKAHER